MSKETKIIVYSKDNPFEKIVIHLSSPSGTSEAIAPPEISINIKEIEKLYGLRRLHFPSKEMKFVTIRTLHIPPPLTI